MPEISVIVPVYRAESFLRKCTDSILNQTFQDLELLLIDDGSPDHSGALCDQIAKEAPRVRVFHKDNGGVSSARNLGMTQANGQYFAFADSDDWLPPDALETLYTALTTAGADTAGGGHWRVEQDGRREAELSDAVGGPAVRTVVGSDAHYLWDIRDRDRFLLLEAAPEDGDGVRQNLIAWLRGDV